MAASFARLGSRVVAVTGGSRGIGLATARAFAGHGFRVAVLARSADECGAVAADLPVMDSAQHHIGVACDVTDHSSVTAAFQEVSAEVGAPTVLVNSAGITMNKLALRTSDADLEAVYQTNVGGAFRCARTVLKSMMAARQGAILNVGSVVGSSGNQGQAAYSASKSALHGMTLSLAKEVGSRGIRVNLVAPGFIETNMTAGLSEAQRADIAAKTMLGRLGDPNDVAEALLWLASDQASFITGQTLAVDGGLRM